MDYIRQDLALVCWIYKISRERVTSFRNPIWAMAGVALEMLQAIRDQEPAASLTVWAGCDPWKRECILAIREDVFLTPVGNMVKLYFGANVKSHPGRSLGLVQAPKRVPIITNLRLCPILRVDHGEIICYGVGESLRGNAGDIKLLHRLWGRAEERQKEQYETTTRVQQLDCDNRA